MVSLDPFFFDLGFASSKSSKSPPWPDFLSFCIDAADASTGWYTKCMERFFQAWYPKYQKAEVARCKDLPDEFLAVDDDTGQTFEWVLPHHAEFQAKLLGTTNAEPAILGQQRTWFVKRVAPTESK